MPAVKFAGAHAAVRSSRKRHLTIQRRQTYSQFLAQIGVQELGQADKLDQSPEESQVVSVKVQKQGMASRLNMAAFQFIELIWNTVIFLILFVNFKNSKVALTACHKSSEILGIAVLSAYGLFVIRSAILTALLLSVRDVNRTETKIESVNVWFDAIIVLALTVWGFVVQQKKIEKHCMADNELIQVVDIWRKVVYLIVCIIGVVHCCLVLARVYRVLSKRAKEMKKGVSDEQDDTSLSNGELEPRQQFDEEQQSDQSMKQLQIQSKDTSIKVIDSCSICMDKFSPEAEVVELSCSVSHVFHHKCIQEWFALAKKNKVEETCPLCRKSGQV